MISPTPQNSSTPQHLALSLAIFLTSPFPAHAEDRPLRPGIIGEDNREIIENSKPPWSAIGQVNVSGLTTVSFCSGTLIGPDRVLTAAHCLIDVRQQKLFRASQVHFVAGANRGANKGHAVAKCIVIHPDFDLTALQAKPDLRQVQINSKNIASDLALIILQAPLEAAGVMSLSSRQLMQNDKITQAGFQADKRQLLTGHRNCTVLQSSSTIIATDCDVVQRSSGGPLVTQKEGTQSIVGVMSATAAGTNIAAAVENLQELTKEPCGTN